MSGETQRSILERYRRTYESLQRRWIRLGRGWQRFRTHRLGVLGIGFLLLVLVVAIFAPVLAPHSTTWTAPTSYGGDDEVKSLQDLAEQEIDHPAPPEFGDPYFAPLGTDHEGHGVLSWLIYGSRMTLYIGLAAALLSSLVGVPLGLISGFYGDTWIDEMIQRLVDIAYGLPFLPLMIVFVAVFGVSTTNIILAIALKSWLNNSIVIRGETLSLKERPFTDAAKVAGASDTRIMFRHLLPNVLPLAFIYLAQDAAFAIIAQASLAFLGLADLTNISWGVMLQWVRVTGHIYDAVWWMIPPGLLITAISASFYFIGYSLEDVTNPHMQTGDGSASRMTSEEGWAEIYSDAVFSLGVVLGVATFSLGLALLIVAVSMTTTPPAPYFTNTTERLVTIGIAAGSMIVGAVVVRGSSGRYAEW